jgi:hypothetical protein
MDHEWERDMTNEEIVEAEMIEERQRWERHFGHVCEGCRNDSWCRGGDCPNNAVPSGHRAE